MNWHFNWEQICLDIFWIVPVETTVEYVDRSKVIYMSLILCRCVFLSVCLITYGLISFVVVFFFLGALSRFFSYETGLASMTSWRSHLITWVWSRVASWRVSVDYWRYIETLISDSAFAFNTAHVEKTSYMSLGTFHCDIFIFSYVFSRSSWLHKLIGKSSRQRFEYGVYDHCFEISSPFNKSHWILASETH